MRPAAFLLAGLLALGASAEVEMRRRYVVKEVQGRVLAWPPLANRWSELSSGDSIWEDTLIQVGENASITFTLSASQGFKGLRAESMDITLNTPILMRLRENIPRRVTLNDYFIPKLPETAEGKEERLLFESIREAWERFAANLLPQDVKSKFLRGLADAEKEAASVSVRAKKIRLYTPGQGSMAITNSLPTEIRLSWKAVPEPGISYGIRIWELDEPRPEPIAFTSQDYYSLQVEKEGSYFAQVTSEDGRWQSEVRQFSVLLPMVGRGKPPSRDRVNLPLPLELPPRNFVFLTEKWPVSVTFTWDKPNGARGRQVYEFILSDTNGKELFKRETSDLLFTLRFSNPGSYRWYVAARPMKEGAAGATRIFSEVRSVTFQQKPRTTAGAPDPLEQLLLVKSARVYYLEGGF